MRPFLNLQEPDGMDHGHASAINHEFALQNGQGLSSAMQQCAAGQNVSPVTLSEVLKRAAAMRDYARQVAENTGAVKRTLCQHNGPSASINTMTPAEGKAQASQGLINDIMAQLGELQTALDMASADLSAVSARIG